MCKAQDNLLVALVLLLLLPLLLLPLLPLLLLQLQPLLPTMQVLVPPLLAVVEVVGVVPPLVDESCAGSSYGVLGVDIAVGVDAVRLRVGSAVVTVVSKGR